MNKVVTLLILFFATTFLSFGQEKSQENNDLNKIIPGKWHVESMKIGNEEMQYAKGDSWMQFNADGNYQVVMSTKEQIGTWELIKGKNELKFDDKNLGKNMKIKKISQKELLVSATEGEIVYTMVLKK